MNYYLEFYLIISSILICSFNCDEAMRLLPQENVAVQQNEILNFLNENKTFPMFANAEVLSSSLNKTDNHTVTSKTNVLPPQTLELITQTLIMSNKTLETITQTPTIIKNVDNITESALINLLNKTIHDDNLFDQIKTNATLSSNLSQAMEKQNTDQTLLEWLADVHKFIESDISRKNANIYVIYFINLIICSITIMGMILGLFKCYKPRQWLLHTFLKDFRRMVNADQLKI